MIFRFVSFSFILYGKNAILNVSTIRVRVTKNSNILGYCRVVGTLHRDRMSKSDILTKTVYSCIYKFPSSSLLSTYQNKYEYLKSLKHVVQQH